MAINPLIVFVGLTVTTLGGLVVVTQQNINPFAKTPVAKLLQQPAPPAPNLGSSETPVKKLASLPKKVQNTETKAPAVDALTVKPKAPVSSAETAPTFDVVRVEGDGGTVIVGRAAPGAEVSLMLNGKVIGQSATNENGDWVFIPDQLLPKGDHELIVEAAGKNGAVLRSAQSIFISMPKGTVEKPLVVVSRPDAPTRVLQKPEVKSETVIAKAVVEKPLQKTAPEAPAPAKTVIEKTASLQTPRAKQPTVLEKTKAPVPAGIVPAGTVPLTFGTVDYNDQGDIVFSGTAKAGKTIRLYIDNQVVGDSQVDQSGNWTFHGRERIKPGEHELRADQVTDNGQVAQRTAVPFVRAKPSAVASLLKKRQSDAVLKVTAIPAPTAPVVTSKKAAKEPVEATPAQPPVTKMAAKEPVKATPAQPTVTKMAAKEPVPVEPVTPEAKKPEMVSHVVIQPGNNLWNISRVIYGKGVAYTTIYQANKKQIKRPDRIYPGQIFTTPGALSSGKIGPDQREPIGSVTENSTAGTN